MSRVGGEATDRSGLLATATGAALVYPAFVVGRRRPGIVLRVKATNLPAAIAVAPLAVQERPAARTAALLREERLERRDGVDLTSTGPAGEPGHGLIVALDRRRAIHFPRSGQPRLRRMEDVVPLIGNR
jgi:hypothetical protein